MTTPQGSHSDLRAALPSLTTDVRSLAETYGHSQAILERIAGRLAELDTSDSTGAEATRTPEAPQTPATPRTPTAGGAHTAPRPVQPRPVQPRPAQPRPAQPLPRDAGSAPQERTIPAVAGYPPLPRRSAAPAGAGPASAPHPAARHERMAPPPPQRPAPVAKKDPWWTKEGAVTRILGIVGGVLTAIGMAFFLAVVFTLVGPVGQVAISCLVGALFGGAGWWLQSRHAATTRARSGRADAGPGGRPGGDDTHVGALALLGTAVAIFMIIPVAASAVYEMLWGPAGLALVFVVAGVGIWIARRLGSTVMAGIASCGSMIALFVVEQTFVTLAAIAAMFVVSGLLTERFGIWLRVARTVTYLAAGAGMFLILSVALHDGGGDHEALSAGTWPYLVIVSVAAAFAMVNGLREIEASTRDLEAGALLALAPTALVALYVFDTEPVYAPFFYVGLALVYIVIGTSVQADTERWTRPTTTYAKVAMSIGTAFLTIGLFWSARELDIDTGYSVLGSALVATCYLTLHLRLRTTFSIVQAALVSVIPLAAVVPHILSKDLWFLSEATVSSPALVLVQFCAASFVLVYALWILVRSFDTTVGAAGAARARLLSYWPWALLSLVWIASTILYAGRMITTATGGNEVYFYLGHLLVTVGCFAVAIWLLTTHRPLPNAKKLGALVFLISMAKLFAVDLATMSAIVRILVFCAVGVMMLATATILSNRADSARPGPGIPEPGRPMTPPRPGGQPLDPQRPGQHADPAAGHRAPAHGPAPDRPAPDRAGTERPGGQGPRPEGPRR